MSTSNLTLYRRNRHSFPVTCSNIISIQLHKERDAGHSLNLCCTVYIRGAKALRLLLNLRGREVCNDIRRC